MGLLIEVGGCDLILPGTSRQDLLIILNFIYTGVTSVQVSQHQPTNIYQAYCQDCYLIMTVK